MAYQASLTVLNECDTVTVTDTTDYTQLPPAQRALISLKITLTKPNGEKVLESQSLVSPVSQFAHTFPTPNLIGIYTVKLVSVPVNTGQELPYIVGDIFYYNDKLYRALRSTSFYPFNFSTADGDFEEIEESDLTSAYIAESEYMSVCHLLFCMRSLVSKFICLLETDHCDDKKFCEHPDFKCLLLSMSAYNILALNFRAITDANRQNYYDIANAWNNCCACNCSSVTTVEEDDDEPDDPSLEVGILSEVCDDSCSGGRLVTFRVTWANLQPGEQITLYITSGVDSYAIDLDPATTSGAEDVVQCVVVGSGEVTAQASQIESVTLPLTVETCVEMQLLAAFYCGGNFNQDIILHLQLSYANIPAGVNIQLSIFDLDTSSLIHDAYIGQTAGSPFEVDFPFPYLASIGNNVTVTVTVLGYGSDNVTPLIVPTCP